MSSYVLQCRVGVALVPACTVLYVHTKWPPDKRCNNSTHHTLAAWQRKIALLVITCHYVPITIICSRGLIISHQTASAIDSSTLQYLLYLQFVPYMCCILTKQLLQQLHTGTEWAAIAHWLSSYTAYWHSSDGILIEQLLHTDRAVIVYWLSSLCKMTE